ncbi:MAG: 3-isopropylmalate dehydrogenase [Candidatus Eremiobacteraeota bacterium]|nr:3-isopropylmalate dehydrogenase [Candidatus Eremiobacteraeota bacterium]
MPTTIAVLPGDGIGPEVTRAATRLLECARPDLTCVEAPVGGCALAAGLPALPDATRALCDRSAAILFGSVGLPEYDGKTLAERPEYALFLLRRDYELYANIRPVRVFPGLEGASSLKEDLVRGLDLVVVRELTGGIYFGAPKEQRNENGVESAVDTMVYFASEIERIARTAFELARARRKHLTSVDKQNILETSRLWRRVVERVAVEYPDVRLEHLLVDNAAMQLVRRPRDFDVIVTENMFGDILSDEAAILTGSIGTLPSASLGTRGAPGTQFGLYEPISGSAPDIAGKGIANPTAAMLSAAMLLRMSCNDPDNAARIESAVASAYAGGARTAEFGGTAPLSTTEFTDAVLGHMR